MARLTDLIRGAKAPASAQPPDEAGKPRADTDASAKAAAEPAKPAQPPLSLSTLKELVGRNAAKTPPAAVSVPPAASVPQPTGATQQTQGATQAAILKAPPIEPVVPLTQARTAVLELPPELTGFTTQATVSPAVHVDWYGKAEAALEGIGAAIGKQRAVSLGELPQIAEGMAESLSADDRLLVRAISHQSGPSLIGNMVHVAIFGVKIGMGLGYRPDELAKLALAALVHDLGMFQLPSEMLEQHGRW
ncbi:MAG: hypothetical protein KGL03_12485, partial [Nitrospirota bacterium]|nr:hypothetical protein [Nitrospirota bacterium]